MVADTSPEPVTLSEILTTVARRATDTQLLAMLLTGLVGAAIIAELLGRQGWLGAAGALAVGAYGGWGIADRELNALWSKPGAARGPVLALRVARGIAAIVATLATVSLFATALIPVLGLMKS